MQQIHNRILGMLVIFTVLSQIFSYSSGFSKAKPKQHTLGLIGCYALLIPFVLKQSSTWISMEMQIVFTVLVVALDWLSFHQDMTRFSEENLCIFGNCRWNARVTGHLAHIGDAVSVAMLLVPLIKDSKLKFATIAGLVVYLVSGMIVIETMTKDGSRSDLRDKTDEEKCLEARIMRGSWRGGLNDLITVLGITLAWQTILNCDTASCDTAIFPLNQLKNLFKVPQNSNSKMQTVWTTLRTGVMSFLLAAAPTYTNYVNTSSQHGLLKSSVYKIPSCFDDEPAEEEKEE